MFLKLPSPAGVMKLPGFAAVVQDFFGDSDIQAINLLRSREQEIQPVFTGDSVFIRHDFTSR